MPTFRQQQDSRKSSIACRESAAFTARSDRRTRATGVIQRRSGKRTRKLVATHQLRCCFPAYSDRRNTPQINQSIPERFVEVAGSPFLISRSPRGSSLSVDRIEVLGGRNVSESAEETPMWRAGTCRAGRGEDVRPADSSPSRRNVTARTDPGRSAAATSAAADGRRRRRACSPAMPPGTVPLGLLPAALNPMTAASQSLT